MMTPCGLRACNQWAESDIGYCTYHEKVRLGLLEPTSHALRSAQGRVRRVTPAPPHHRPTLDEGTALWSLLRNLSTETRLTASYDANR